MEGNGKRILTLFLLINFYCSICAQSCLTLFCLMHCRLPGSSGTFQAIILELGAISYSKGSSQPRDQSCVSCISCISRWILYPLVAPGKPLLEQSYFTVLCQFLLYSKVNWLYVYVHLLFLDFLPILTLHSFYTMHFAQFISLHLHCLL